jgi:predicted DNA repair protein MutK
LTKRVPIARSKSNASAALARLAAASADDATAAAVRAGSKTVGVVIDDAAVTPGYVIGLPSERESPIIAKIAIGSLRNKLLFILPAALLLSAFAKTDADLDAWRPLSQLRGRRKDYQVA